MTAVGVASGRWRVVFGRVNRNGAPDNALERVADVVHSAAVLIRAGIPPPAVWAYLAESRVSRESHPGDQSRPHRSRGHRTRGGRSREDVAMTDVSGVLRGIAAAREEQTSDAIAASALRASGPERTAWRALACVWRVAERSGAPMADCLVSLADSLRSIAATDREVDVALAGPVSTVRLLSALPIVSIGLAWCLGFDVPATLATTSVGGALAATGLALWCAGVIWGRRLIARARSVRPLAGFELDLVAVAAVGEPTHEAAGAVAIEALDRCGLSSAREIDDSRAVFDLAASAGIPAQSLLRSRAEHARRCDRHSSRRAIARLEVSLVLPLGLCIMPAFIALGIAPVVLSLFISTVAELSG